MGKSISQSYQGLMTWGFNDAEHPLCDENLFVHTVKNYLFTVVLCCIIF